MHMRLKESGVYTIDVHNAKFGFVEHSHTLKHCIRLQVDITPKRYINGVVEIEKHSIIQNTNTNWTLSDSHNSII